MITNLLVGSFLFFICVVPILIVATIIRGFIFLIEIKEISTTSKILIIITILLLIFIIFINIYHESFNDTYKKMNRMNKDKKLVGLTKEEVVELLGEPKGEFHNERAKGYRYDAGYVSKEIHFLGNTFWLKTYYYEFIVYFDETDKVKSTLRKEAERLGG